MKVTVNNRIYENGDFQRVVSEKRTIYDRKDGTQYVRVMGNKKEVVPYKGIPTFETHYRRVQATPTKEILESLRGKTGVVAFGDGGFVIGVTIPKK